MERHVLCCLLQLAGGVILGVALWLRHDPKTSSLLELNLDGAHAPSTFYISMYLICCVGLFKCECSPRYKGILNPVLAYHFNVIKYSEVSLMCCDDVN